MAMIAIRCNYDCELLQVSSYQQPEGAQDKGPSSSWQREGRNITAWNLGNPGTIGTVELLGVRYRQPGGLNNIGALLISLFRLSH